MSLKICKTLAMILALGVPSAGLAADVTRKTQAGPDWGFQRLTWDDSSNRTEYRYAVFNRDGFLEICGVFSTRGAKVGRFGRLAMTEAVLMMNGKRTVRDMSFFREVSNREMSNRLVGSKANCTMTEIAAPQRMLRVSIVVPGNRIKLR